MVGDARNPRIGQPMPLVLGGFTPTLRVAALAQARNARISLINTPGSIAAPLAAALPNGEPMEFLDLGRGEALGWKPRVLDGRLQLSERPGLGLRPANDLARRPRPPDGYDGPEIAGLESALQ